MDTQILKESQETFLMASELIGKGEVVAFATETVYGLGANAFDEKAVAKIFKAKGRPGDNPLIVHLSKVEDIEKVCENFDERAKKVASKFMPGALTIILKKRDCIPDNVSAGLKTVAVRIPSHTGARQFIDACDTPICAPSANISTKISPTSAESVFEDMKGRIPLIIDGGSCEVGIESTVLDLSTETPTILRPGAITQEDLLQVLDEVATFKGKVISVAPAPGMKYKHYAPVVPMVIAKNIESAINHYDEVLALNPVILAKSEDIEKLSDMKTLDLGGTDREVCHSIYASMHYAEKKFGYIICIDLGENGVFGSVMNRVLKAGGGVIV